MSENKRIIFLDIDGVLNYEEYYKEPITGEESFGERYICKDKIKIINYLCEVINADVVISSTHRFSYTIKQFQEIFNERGATFSIINITPHTGYARGTEVDIWLKKNKDIDFWEYIILDDDNDFFIDQIPNFFQCDSYVGITYTVAENARRFITKQFFNKK